MPSGFSLAPFDEDGFGVGCAGLIVADRYDAEVIRERFARRAARRLAGDLDPGLAGLD